MKQAHCLADQNFFTFDRGCIRPICNINLMQYVVWRPPFVTHLIDVPDPPSIHKHGIFMLPWSCLDVCYILPHILWMFSTLNLISPRHSEVTRDSGVQHPSIFVSAWFLIIHDTHGRSDQSWEHAVMHWNTCYSPITIPSSPVAG